MNNSDRFVITQKIILYILPILSLIAIIIPLILGQKNLMILGSYIVIPMFFAPIIYLMRRKNIDAYFSNYKNKISSPNKKYYQDHWFILLVILYVLGFSVSIFILGIFDVRPFAYYGIITFLVTIILFEILLFDIYNKKSNVILLQIVLICLNIVWGVNLKYFHFIGRTDPLVHTWYISNLINNGYVTSIFNFYQSFPLWHIFIASGYILLNINFPIYKFMYFVNGLNFAIMLLVIYLLSLKIFKDKRIALMSALFASFTTNMIIDMMSSNPRSAVSFLEILLILLLLSLDIRKVFLAIILTFIIIRYHTASMPFIIVIFLIIYFLNKLYIKKTSQKFITSNYVLLAIVATLGNYIYNGISVFELLINNIDNPGATGTITKSIIYAPVNELFNYLQFSMLLFFIFIGILWVLESQIFSEFEKIFCLTGFLLVSVTFPGPALLSNKLSGNFSFERFGEYSSFLIVIVTAIGFIGIFYGAGRKLKVILTILFIFTALFSISNDFTASDNPLVKRVSYTFYLKEEETLAFNHIANITDGYMLSDYITDRYLQSSSYMNRTNILQIDLKNRSLKNASNDTIIIRDEELKKRPLRFSPSVTGKFQLDPDEKYYNYYFSDALLWNDLEKHSKIYDSGMVSGYN